MTNIMYRNLTREEAEQMAFELEVEGRFKFEVKEEGASWSVHYWSEDEAPGATAPKEAPTRPARETPPVAPPGGLSESAGPTPVAPPAPSPAAPTAPARDTSRVAPAGGLSESTGPASVEPPAAPPPQGSTALARETSRAVPAGSPSGPTSSAPAVSPEAPAAPPRDTSPAASPGGLAESVRSAPTAPARPPLFNPPVGWILGSLSRKYEVGDRGPETVSTGAGDPGGVSYGSYQMTSRGGGTVLRFVRDGAFPWPNRFAGLTPGSEEFSARWRALAAEAPKPFFEAQHAFIERTHFAPLVRKIRLASGLDVALRSHALQDAVWSTAVQHGPNSLVPRRALVALGWLDVLPPDDLDGDRRLISAIYAERRRRRTDGRLAYFPRVTSSRVQKSLADRFVNEERDALAMLDA